MVYTLLMSIAFAIHIKGLFVPKTKAAIDGGFCLQGTNGKAVILIHGLTGTPNEMRFLANFLNRAGFTVQCPRLANHGTSIHILKKTTWQECYQTVRRTYADLRRSHDRIYVSGLSMGALLALLLAEEFKATTAAVSCLSPTLFYDGWNCPWYRFLLPLGYLTPLKHFFYFKEGPPYGVKNEAIRRRIHEYYSRADLDNLQGVDQFGYPFFPVALLHQLQKLVVYLKGRLPNINAPVQLIQAQHDDMTSVRNAQFIYDRISSKHKEIVLLHNSYHIITADQERATVASRMAAFFAP